MLTEPALDRGRLQATLRSAYGLNVVQLEFLPKGEESWNYVVTCDDGSCYLCQIRAAASPQGELMRRIYGPLPPREELYEFVYRLRHECGLCEVVCPRRTVSGEMSTTFVTAFDGHVAALFPYIDGHSLADGHPSQDCLHQLGRSLARIHGCATLQDACPTVERFDIWGRDELHRVLAALEDGEDTFRGYQATVRDLLLPARATLEEQFAVLQAVQRKVRNLDLTFVICHGEPSPGNVLFGEAGRVYLVDWCTVMLAPRERDLVFFLEPQYQMMLDGYRSGVPDMDLDEVVIEFYQRQWTMSEIAFFSSRILFTNTTDEESVRDMDELLQVLGWIGIP